MRRRQSEVIVGDAVLRLLALGQCFLGRVVQVPGGIAPGTEVVLVDDDAIPVDQMDRLVVRLDAAVRRAAAQILERREPDLWILAVRSEEHTSELQSLMRISYAVFCLKKKKHTIQTTHKYTTLQ